MSLVDPTGMREVIEWEVEKRSTFRFLRFRKNFPDGFVAEIVQYPPQGLVITKVFTKSECEVRANDPNYPQKEFMQAVLKDWPA